MANRFIVDTNVLIHLDYFNKKVFKSLWANIDEMIQKEELISLKEVFLELNKVDDRISDYWNGINNTHEFFIDPPDEALAYLPELEQFEIFQDYGKEKPLWADPHLITYGMAKNATIITQETLNKHPKRKIPFVCNEIGVDCVNLDEFMISNGWEW
ncbi:DUF4411 family protein [Methanobacterium formicicum]|uniref:DUF4411 family protein n=1 Tax=Methanobacterium formicicum TaxID=2162 RepID=UPI0024129A82|nr:DUF4411 family protein [Methanobacterium formicicum]MDG3546620.1 DUF4411 family protein [Methanobacterium formicicum]